MQLRQGWPGFAWRASKRYRSARQRHHAKENRFNRGLGFDVANPRWQFPESGRRNRTKKQRS